MRPDTTTIRCWIAKKPIGMDYLGNLRHAFFEGLNSIAITLVEWRIQSLRVQT